MSLAVVIIAHPQRQDTTFRRCLESVIAEKPDEIVVVADYPVEAKGVRSLVVPSHTKSTVDALAKRDAGYMATLTSHICYLVDDHALMPGFMDAYCQRYEPDQKAWEILVPSRCCWRTPPEQTQAFLQEWLNVGEEFGYAGGHCAIYARACGYLLPWSATKHHPNWDVLHTLQLKDQGCRIAYADKDLAVEDISPGDKPWAMTVEQHQGHQAFGKWVKGGSWRSM